MGQGIAAGIPLSFTLHRYTYPDSLEKYFLEGYENKRDEYCIKEGLLLSNYRDFLSGFYALIEEDMLERCDIKQDDTILTLTDYDTFTSAFGQEPRNCAMPFIGTYAPFFTTKIETDNVFLFYSGSYKAFLEEYTTLYHFEKILRKALHNPLTNLVKYGIYG